MFVQKELDQAFATNLAARQIFRRLPPSHQKEYVDWIVAAKKEDTRIRRANQAIEMLLQNQVDRTNSRT